MQDIINTFVTQFAAPMLIAILSAACAWVVTKLPGPLRNALQNSATLAGSAVRINDVVLVAGEMKRRAEAQISPVLQTGSGTADIIHYTEAAIGEITDKPAFSSEVLQTMAASAIATAAAAAAPTALPAPAA